jgi:RNA polymerase sigma factor (sigma-70 family)
VDGPNDEVLVARMRHDPAALDAFYRRHVDRVLSFALRRVRTPDDAADLTSAVFLAAIDAAPRFDASRGTAVGWLYGIAWNLLATQRREYQREAERRSRHGNRRLTTHDEYALLEERLAASAASPDLQRALDTLPEIQRRLLELVALEEMSPSEAGRALGLRSPIARVYLSRARRSVRRELQDHAPDAVLPAQPPAPITAEVQP